MRHVEFVVQQFLDSKCSITLFACIHSALCFSGSFGEAGAQTDQCVEWLREYCQAFFYGLSVKLLPAVTVAETKCSFRVNSDSHNLQILTGELGVHHFDLRIPFIVPYLLWGSGNMQESPSEV